MLFYENTEKGFAVDLESDAGEVITINVQGVCCEAKAEVFLRSVIKFPNHWSVMGLPRPRREYLHE
jgi:hypothetical protein